MEILFCFAPQNPSDCDVICKDDTINYDSFKNQLNNLEFGSFYLNKVSSRDFSIEYNKSTSIQALSVVDAGKKYNYPNENFYDVSIDKQIDILDRSGKLDSKDLLLTCIEIFDWGDVQKSNILSAFKLYRDCELEAYLRKAKVWYEDDSSLREPEFNVIWSSGWTKVYSFLFAYVTIYDSRVAAFINQVLKEFWLFSSEAERTKLKEFSNGLLTFVS